MGKNPIAECDGRLYVRLEAVMHPMIAFGDGIPLTFFGKDRKNPYLPIDDAISWCERENKDIPSKHRTFVLDMLRKCKAKFASGDFEYSDARIAREMESE